jgi:hypothetical protein
MKKWIFTELFLVVFLVFLASCQGQQKSAGFKGSLLLSVDFKPDVPLKYSFVSERQATLDLDSSGKVSKGGRGSKSFTEKLEMEIVYRPIEIDPYGYSIIEATCNSAKVTRGSGGGSRGRDSSDAVESVAGRSFTIKITPTGEIVDYTSLESLVKELGEKAFGATSKMGRVKDPDMIMDFVATQRHLWDTVSSIKNPLKGLKKGDMWNSRLLSPMPFVSMEGRDVEYKFAGITEANGVSLAEITSSYKLSQESLKDIPIPYSGSFQMRGTFGFLRGYQVHSIEGSGRQLYDIERGLIKSDIQRYQTEISASVFGISTASITSDQTITMTLVE